MRVSTSMVYGMGAGRIGQQQSDLLRTQQQLSTGRKMLVPSDDPVAAARSLREAQSKATADQYLVNQDSARAALSLGESTLGDAGDAIADARTLLVSAANGSLTDADRRSIAIGLQSSHDRLLALANTRDANGEFLFSGFKGGTQAFTPAAGGAQYAGDQGTREMAVADGRMLPVSENGSEVFERVPGGNGVFTIAPGGANAGTGVHDGGAVADPALLDGHGYTIQFTVAGATTTYDVVDTTTSANVVTGAAYAAGQAITFGGLQVVVNGAPANGDAFAVAPSASVSVFKTLQDAITLLQAPAPTAVARAALNNGIASAIPTLDQAAGRVLDARARMGVHLQELDSLSALVSGTSLQHAQELSRLTDLDYAEAVTRFASQQAALQAAQQSFLRVSNLSLFDLL